QKAVAQISEGDGYAAFHDVTALFAATGSDTHDIDRAMADVVIQIANKVFGGHFPVAVHTPLQYAAYDFRPARAAIAVIQRRIQVIAHVSYVFFEGWGVFIPGRPDGAFVVVDLRDAFQPPLFLVQFTF